MCTGLLGPGRSGGCPPELPQIRACRLPAPGSSSHEFATCAIRRRCVDTAQVSVYLACFPPTGHETAPPSLGGVPRVGSPASTVLWGAATPCRPSRRTSFPSLGDTIGASVVRPPRPRTRSRGSIWSWWAVSPAALLDGNGRVSQVPRGSLVIIRPVLRPRRDQAGSVGPCVSCLTRPPRLTRTRAHHEEISGLNRTAFDLAVYASQGWSPTHHARLASGRWPGSTGRDWLPAGFPTKGFKF